MSELPPTTQAWADQTGARMRDVGKALIEASERADVPIVAADLPLEIIEGDGQVRVRIAYEREDDTLWCLPNGQPERAFALDKKKLGIR